ncbi:MAG TPA: hypothetical protein VFH85_02165 [Gammaproteobacteria bacterium]|nr:hypothetical protein [Gammaproteobacteria bacterium]
MLYQRSELRDAVLHELGVVDAQGAPSAEDAKLANDRCQQQLEYLYDAGLIPFDLDGAIPARFFIPLTSIIAYRVSGPYGIKDAQLGANAASGMRDLHRLNQKRYLGAPQQAVYF